jgi:hypothetical protein
MRSCFPLRICALMASHQYIPGCAANPAGSAPEESAAPSEAETETCSEERAGGTKTPRDSFPPVTPVTFAASFTADGATHPAVKKVMLTGDCNVSELCYYRDRSTKFSSVPRNSIDPRTPRQNSGADLRPSCRLRAAVGRKALGFSPRWSCCQNTVDEPDRLYNGGAGKE